MCSDCDKYLYVLHVKMLRLFFVGVLSGVSANNLFASSVFNEVAKAKQDENFIVSPFSAEIVLALTQSGAKAETAQEVRNALNLQQNPQIINENFKSLLLAIKSSQNYTLNSANKIYIKTNFSLKEDFKKIAEDVYQSEIESIDFFPDTGKAAQTMNQWVEKKTEKKIQNVVNPKILDEYTRLVLINALHFKADWMNQFDLLSTSKQNFYKTSSDSVEVDFMHESSDYSYYESTEINAKFLEIPFKGNGASFVIILPNEKEGLSALEKHAEKLFAKQNFSSHYVNVHLPKFKITSDTDFVAILKNLGVNKIFDEGKADLSGIAGKAGDLYVSKVLQKAFIDVSENGVEAAAATIVLVPIPPSLEFHPVQKDFIADHPFIFYIKVKDIILFVGKVVSPEI